MYLYTDMFSYKCAQTYPIPELLTINYSYKEAINELTAIWYHSNAMLHIWVLLWLLTYNFCAVTWTFSWVFSSLIINLKFISTSTPSLSKWFSWSTWNDSHINLLNIRCMHSHMHATQKLFTATVIIKCTVTVWYRANYHY